MLMNDEMETGTTTNGILGFLSQQLPKTTNEAQGIPDACDFPNALFFDDATVHGANHNLFVYDLPRSNQ